MITEADCRVRGADVLLHRKHTEAKRYEILFVHGGGGHIFVRDRLCPMLVGAVYFIAAEEVRCSMPASPQDSVAAWALAYVGEHL